MKIVTVSREFGSGGRELGKRLADELGFAYYDREIISAIAKDTELNEAYIASTLEHGISGYNINFGVTLSATSVISQNTVDILIAQQRIMKEIAIKGDCVIVGRSADVILEKYNPFNIFVYSDTESKVARCRAREDGEQLSDKQLIKKIRQIDKNRAKLHSMVARSDWGDKDSYQLMVNTSGFTIKDLVPMTADFARAWFEKHHD